MSPRNVTATEFRNHAGTYIDAAAKAPVVITKHSRPSRVLLDFDEYERLKAYDTRVSFRTDELPEEDAAAFAGGYEGRKTPEYD
jgi:prevent-host-death family protein